VTKTDEIRTSRLGLASGGEIKNHLRCQDLDKTFKNSLGNLTREWVRLNEIAAGGQIVGRFINNYILSKRCDLWRVLLPVYARSPRVAVHWTCIKPRFKLDLVFESPVRSGLLAPSALRASVSWKHQVIDTIKHRWQTPLHVPPWGVVDDHWQVMVSRDQSCTMARTSTSSLGWWFE